MATIEDAHNITAMKYTQTKRTFDQTGRLCQTQPLRGSAHSAHNSKALRQRCRGGQSILQKRASWPSVSISSIQHCSPSSISLTEGFISCPKARGRRRASRIALPGQDDGSGLRLRGRRLVPPMRGLRHRHGRFCDGVPLPGGGFKDCIARERCPGETKAEKSPCSRCDERYVLQDQPVPMCHFCRGQAWSCPRPGKHG